MSSKGCVLVDECLENQIFYTQLKEFIIHRPLLQYRRDAVLMCPVVIEDKNETHLKRPEPELKSEIKTQGETCVSCYRIRWYLDT